MFGVFDGLWGSSKPEEKKKEFTLGDVSGYFKPGASIQNGANSLTAAGETDPTMWQKAKGQTSALFDSGEKDLGALYADVDFDDPANEELLGVIADAEGEIAAAKEDEGVDWAAMARMLQSVKPNKGPAVTGAGRVGGGFRFDRKPYENQLLTREYESLYNQPLYNKLG